MNSNQSKISCKRGFTLIELLVVVLIIGILAAVAVPQYQVAVTKSRYSTLKNLATSIKNAQEIYYLSNGEYARSFQFLDIGMPGGQLNNSTNEIYYYDWGNCTLALALVYCTNSHTNMYYQVNYSHSPNEESWKSDQRGCGTFDKSSVKMRVCQQETGKSTPDFEDTGYAIWFY